MTFIFRCGGLARIEQLYAFDYQPAPPFDSTDGWSVYSPKEEFARMGVGTRSKAWRFTDINKDYSVRSSRTWCSRSNPSRFLGSPFGRLLTYELVLDLLAIMIAFNVPSCLPLPSVLPHLPGAIGDTGSH